MFDSFIHESLKALRNTTVTESATYFIRTLRIIFPLTPLIYFKQNFDPPFFIKSSSLIMLDSVIKVNEKFYPQKLMGNVNMKTNNKIENRLHDDLEPSSSDNETDDESDNDESKKYDNESDNESND